MFNEHTSWTNDPCFYVMAYSTTRRVWLAGPYRFMTEAEGVLGHAQNWALKDGRDPDAACYRYEVYRHHDGHTRSILGEIRP